MTNRRQLQSAALPRTRRRRRRERDGASLSRADEEDAGARTLPRANPLSLAATVMAPLGREAERRASARPAPGVAGKQHGLPDAGPAKLLDDRVRAGPKLLREREERRLLFAVGQSNADPAPREGESPSTAVIAAEPRAKPRADPPALP
jgi:hypothetical protein